MQTVLYHQPDYFASRQGALTKEYVLISIYIQQHPDMGNPILQKLFRAGSKSQVFIWFSPFSRQVIAFQAKVHYNMTQ